MTVNDWLLEATEQLKTAKIDTARLDALVLLGDVLNKNSAQVLAQASSILSNEQKQRLEEALKRRKSHEPLAYIRGKSEFYGQQFLVDKSVLVPRPESESIIDLVRDLPAAQQQHFLDVGTGSGALAITIAGLFPQATVVGADINQAALTIAGQNAKRLNTTVKFVKSNLLKKIDLEPPVTILANLPYVPDDYEINPAAMHEPKLALFGGSDGLDLYRQLFQQLVAKGNRGVVITEAMPFQHQELAEIAQKYGYQQIKIENYAQAFKA